MFVGQLNDCSDRDKDFHYLFRVCIGNNTSGPSKFWGNSFKTKLEYLRDNDLITHFNYKEEHEINDTICST